MRMPWIVAVCCLLVAWLPVAPSWAAESRQPNPKLQALVESYYDAYLELNPILATFNGDHRFNDRFNIAISPAGMRQADELEARYLKQARALDSVALDARDRITLEIFIHGREEALNGARFPGHLLPVNQFSSAPLILAQIGAGTSFQPFDTVKDYDNWLKRLAVWPAWVDQAMVNMREGMEQGIVQSRVIMEKVLPQLRAQMPSSAEASVFFQPIQNMPVDFSGRDRKRLTTAYKATINTRVVPGYRKLHDFIRDEYLPKTRDSIGLSALSGGAAWYAHEVRRHTTTDLTPEEIHKIGRQEVARLQAEISAVRQGKSGDSGFLSRLFGAGSSAAPRSFTSEEDMLDSYRSLRETVHAKLPKLFAEFPKADYEIRAVEPFRQRTAAGGSYVAGAPDGSRPGVFYVNTGNWRSRSTRGNEALFLHEAMPGHHFQISIQRESGDLPRFRRFGSFTAYTEGWALYVESLGSDLGLYRSPAQYVAALNSELFRARRLVVDTGIHGLGWTRRQAIDYLGSVREVERYMVLPGQALAYKMGQLKIVELRRRAEERLGNAFDIREFHSIVLREGAMPLTVLEGSIDRWIADVRAARRAQANAEGADGR